MEGCAVAEETPEAGQVLLAPHLVRLAEIADGTADDLPSPTLFVHGAPADRLGRVGSCLLDA